MTDPTPTPAPAPSAATPSFGPGQILGLIGAAAIAISSWLTWLKGVFGDSDRSSHEGPAKFLIDYNSQPGGLSIGTLLVIIGAIGILGALLAQLRVLSLIAGAGGIVVGALFAYQVKSIVDDFGQGEVSFGDLFGIGGYIAILGGAVALVGGILSLRSS